MKTNYQMLVKLDKEYHPKKFGFIADDEYELIAETLELEDRDGLSLCNLRDMVVMEYTIQHTMGREEGKNTREVMDKMSAVTYVIDTYKVKQGLEP